MCRREFVVAGALPWKVCRVGTLFHRHVSSNEPPHRRRGGVGARDAGLRGLSPEDPVGIEQIVDEPPLRLAQNHTRFQARSRVFPT